MIRKSYFNIKKLIICSLVIMGYATVLLAQTKISGVINKYGNVTSLGADYVIINDATQFSQFSELDTVLLIQMKGVRIYVSEDDELYGGIEEKYGQPGMHEFLVIKNIETGNKKIIFQKTIDNNFNVDGIFQIVKVPSYNSAVVDGSDLTCAPWDSVSKTGGVLAFFVWKTLSLNRNIDVTGKGFAGGAASIGAGLCVNSDAPTLDKYAFDSGSLYSGFKGESPAIRGDAAGYPSIFPGYSKGKGMNFTGGGGGNGRFSGGGGGSNYGLGGYGGYEKNDCSSPEPGGVGGISLINSELDGNLFLGGGGGSSTYLDGSTASPGGKGGGIIIIICDTLKGNGKSILANGAAASPASLNGGAGGGGGGGSVAINLESFSGDLSTSELKIYANGGNGGEHTGTFGQGGGGGGGVIMVRNNSSVPSNVTLAVAKGLKGYSSSISYAEDGKPGDNTKTFTPVLNGFLFNSIRSSVTGTQVDSICSNVVPKEISGTLPVGGTGPYIYLWQKSYDLSGPATDIPSSATVNFSPSAPESDTVWFRRIVTDSGKGLTDTSNWVEIRVQPAITDNLVGKDTVICINQNPLSLVPLNSGPANGNRLYEYKWIQNLTNSWDASSDATGTITGNSYDPPALTNTTYYKRIVNSGRCVDTSSVVTITVLPSVTGNIISRSDSVICEGNLFNPLGASSVSGGDMSYKYLWQDSTVSGVWSHASGVNNGTVYSVDTANFSVMENRYLRRVVYSGADDVCRNNSSPIQLTRYFKIENNSISADQTIGHDSIPDPLVGTTPVNGGGAYEYLWESGITATSWNTADLVSNGKDYSPGSLSDTTWYRRIVLSGSIRKACKDTSNIVKVNVHDPIITNNISLISGAVEDTICYGSESPSIKGTLPGGGTGIAGDYSYKWFNSPTGSDPWIEISDSTKQNLYPGILLQTTYFRRDAGSPAVTPESVSKSNYIKITVLPLIANAISGSDTVCYGTQPVSLKTKTLSGGDNTYIYSWQDSTDVSGWGNIPGGTAENYQPSNLTDPAKYRRTVFSGNNNCCISTSNTITIGIYDLPTGTITSTSDTTFCEGSKVRLKIHLTGQSKWNVIYNDGSSNSPEIRISSADTTLLVTPSTGIAHTSFNYSFASVNDNNGCIATSLSGTRKAEVYKVPVANAGEPLTVCGSKVTLGATPSYGTGIWSYPSSVITIEQSDPSTKVVIDSTFTGSSISHKFYWEETNWKCKNKDSVIITFNKRISSINAGADTTLYSFDNVIHMTADQPSLGTGLWSLISGTGDPEDETDNLTIIRNLSKGINTFLWTIYNGPYGAIGTCVLQDSISIKVVDIFIPEGFSPNNDNFNNAFKITGLDLPNQTAELTIVNGAGAKVFSTTNRDGQEWTDWDGKNSRGQDLPEGTYYYLLKIVSNAGGGQVFKKSGFIILKRY